jgi:adenosylmethionine-8-amino-7-oxononanoate aminotransferase
MTAQSNANSGSYGIQSLPRISHGQGSYLFDVTGKRYLDGSGGPAVYCLGHAHPEVTEAVKSQMDRIAHAYRYLFTSDAADELAEILARKTGLPHSVMVSSGSEAVESCLKIALQYQTAIGQKTRRRFIARRRSWHGNTLGALSVSEFKSRRDPFEGSLLQVSHISPANTYRMPDGITDQAGLVAHLAAELEQEILRLGADQVAAFIFEPVVGAAGGVVPAPAGYARAMQVVCQRHGVLVIGDEVMCGSGRTGTWMALEQDGISPDILSVAKGLAAGYVPLGAALYSDKVADALRAAHGAVMTGHTFTGHTAACAAGVAVQRVVERDGLLAHVKTRGETLRADLARALADLPEVGDIRGRGYFTGLEIVRDPVAKTPFAPGLKVHAEIGRIAFDHGLICYPGTGNVDGVAGDTVILAPPYNASEDELAELVGTLTLAIKQAVHGAKTG